MSQIKTDQIEIRLRALMAKAGLKESKTVPFNQQLSSIEFVTFILSVENEFHFELNPAEFEQKEWQDCESLVKMIIRLTKN